MPTPLDPTPIDNQEAEKDYDRYVPEARALAAPEILPYRADPNLAYHNAKAGQAAVLARKAELERHFSAEELARMDELDHLALAVVFAASQVNRLQERSPGEIGKLVHEAAELRRVLLRGAEACAAAQLIPEADVAKIQQGSGKLDAAQDCVDLAALYRRFAAQLEHKTPATPETIDRAAAVGTELLTLIKPAGATKEKPVPESVKAAAEVRDRLWTLVVKGHEKLWQAGAMLFGKQVDDHVPALQSRAR